MKAVVSEPDISSVPVAEQPAEPGGRPWRRWSALLVIAALAGLSYAWALGRDPLEIYYAAAVRSMSMSWHNFFFGAFDPAGTVTVDKLPGAFWIQALAVRAFGFHTWAIVLPQVLEGVLDRAGALPGGAAAGRARRRPIAAAVVAVSPATVALNRGNISDSLMILLLVLAADAVSRAIARGRLGKLVLAGGLDRAGLPGQDDRGLAGAARVRPGLPGGRRRDRMCGRMRQLVVAGVVAGLVSLSWMTLVSLVPASHRPYVDGSHDDSAYQQVFVYNGFGRFGDQTPLQLLAGQRWASRRRCPRRPGPGPAVARRPGPRHGLADPGRADRRGLGGSSAGGGAARRPAAGRASSCGAAGSSRWR